jgi:hypothetical protein
MGELGIKGGRLMRESNASSPGDFLETESIVRHHRVAVGGCTEGCAVFGYLLEYHGYGDQSDKKSAQQ